MGYVFETALNHDSHIPSFDLTEEKQKWQKKNHAAIGNEIIFNFALISIAVAEKKNRNKV